MMLINISVYDICCHTTLLKWTILGSDDDLATLLLLFHEVKYAEVRLCIYFKYVCIHVYRLWVQKLSQESCLIMQLKTFMWEIRKKLLTLLVTTP